MRFRLTAARTCGPLTGNPPGKQNAVSFLESLQLSKYPIDYLIKTVIPNSPPGFSLPFSRLTSPETLDATSCPQLLKGCADQVYADARTLPLEVGHGKCQRT